MSETSEQLRRQTRDEVENYKQTVKALLAFSAFVVHDGREQRPGAGFGLGRRMGTSKENRVRPSDSVNPDLIAQKSTGYGVTAEVKKSLPQDQTLWATYLQQLLKYDDDLTGWWTTDEKMPCADAVLLLHHSRSRAFCRFVQLTQAEEPERVGENSSIVEFGSSDETASYYFFRLEHGTIRDPELLGILQDGIQIPLDKVLQSFPNLRFYDSPPPMAFLLTELWMGVFPAMLDGAEYDEKYKANRFPASVLEVTSELQRAYGSETHFSDDRSVQFPTQGWIKEAFEKLVELRMALPPSDGGDAYQILFRKTRGDVLSRFIDLVLGLGGDGEGVSVDGTQLPLFSEDEPAE